MNLEHLSIGKDRFGSCNQRDHAFQDIVIAQHQASNE